MVTLHPRNPSWEFHPFAVRRNLCSVCHEPIQKEAIQPVDRQRLLASVDSFSSLRIHYPLL